MIPINSEICDNDNCQETDCGPSTDMGYSVDCKTEITGIRLFKWAGIKTVY